MNLHQLAEKAFEDLKPASLMAYHQRWLLFLEAMDTPNLETLTELKGIEVQERLLEYGKKHELKPATLVGWLAAARRVLRYALLRGLVARDPTAGVRIKVGDNVPHWNVLKKGELERLAKRLKKGSLERAIVLALALQGLRVSELVNATWGQVEVDPATGKKRLVFAGKGDKRASMVLQKVVVEALEALCEGRVVASAPLVHRDHQPLSRIWVTKRIAQLTKEYLGHRVTAHGLRATFTSDVISRKGIEAARQLARHSNLSTTQRYSRWVATEDDERTL